MPAKQKQEEQKVIFGAGIGLRNAHATQIIRERPEISWLEIIADNYFASGGLALEQLEEICKIYPITIHSVGLSIGSTDPLDFDYLKKIKKLIRCFNPVMVSEHLCWTSVHGQHFHDLLPLPYNQETVRHVSARIKEVQDYLEREILIENVSSYLNFTNSTMPEWEFVNAVSQEAGCSILLDINNIYISAFNHEFEALDYINGILPNKVKQIHLGGFEEREGYLLDAHNSPVAEQVWELYAEVIRMLGPIPTLIEWDNELPELSIVLDQTRRAQSIMDAGYLIKHTSNKHACSCKTTNALS